MSSATQMMPSRSAMAVISFCWKISLLVLRPKGSRVQRYSPNGVAKVVNLLDSSSSCTCQNPFWRSKFVNTFDWPSSGMTSSSVGSCTGTSFRALLSGLGSMHTRHFPSA